jgi:GcrA cell cycle regulator
MSTKIAAPAKPSKSSTRQKTLLELEPCDCRWPIGEPRQDDFRFCGEPSLDGRPYCAHHWSMAFQPARPRHQAPAALLAERPKAA